MPTRDADKLLDLSTAAGAAIARGFQEAVRAELRKRNPRLGALSADLATIVDRFRPQLTAAVFDSQVAGYVVGAAGIAAPLARPRSTEFPPLYELKPADIRFALYGPGGPSIEFPIIDSAISQLTKAETLSAGVYYEISAAARRDAFTITAAVSDGTVERVREILAENVFEKTSRTEFMDRVERELPSLPISEAHLEQVFRNNVNAAYSDGGEKALADPLVGSAFPYRAYYPIRDDRARPEHLALEFLGLDGTNVYHFRDPVWLMFRPPWDWNCRCGWNPLTIRRAANKGVRFAQQWLDTGIEPPNQFVAWPPFLPSASWQRIQQN